MTRESIETREERFRRLATKRTNSILDDLRKLGNLSNRINYKYSEEDVERIFTAIYEAVADVESQFSKQDKQDFQL